MAKSKSAKPDKASKVSKDAQVKSLSSVKQGGVTKPSQTSKSKSKEMAKQVAVKADKKSKKAKKEPTPVPESASDDDSSESSASSEDESEVDAPAPTKATKTNGTKANGVSKAAAVIEDEDSESSDSASSDDEPTAPKSAPAAAAKAVAGAKEDLDSDESEATSEGTSDNEDEPKVKGAIDAKALNGKLETVASKEASSDDESDSEAGGTSSGTSDESSSGDESVEEAAPAPKKRKAEAEATPVTKKAKTDSGADDAAQKNLFVGHLSYNVDEEWLTREFEEFGELTRVKVILDRDSGQSKGFGYVEFLNAEDGVKAQAAMHEKEIDGRAVNVDFSKPKTEAAPRQERQKTYGDNTSPASETIFVANLPFEITEDAVAEEFQKHGAVLGVRLPTDRDTGNPKGFGYVQFGSVEESQDVFNKMTGAVIMGRPIRMDFSTPRPPREDGASGGRGGRGGGRGGRGGFDRGGRGGGRGRGGFDRGGGRGGRGGSTNRGGFGDFKGQKKTF